MQDIIRAEIIGNNTATACNITCKGRTPILTLCRALFRKGYDPSLSLRCYRGDVLALTIRTSVTGQADSQRRHPPQATALRNLPCARNSGGDRWQVHR
jgi:hypothetical protein